MDDFEDIYKTYFIDVYRYIKSISNDSSLAEEITQDTFFKALKGIKNFKGRCSVKVWLCQIGKNTYYTHIKKRKNLRNLDNVEIKGEEEIDEELIRKENLLEINREANKLKNPYKEVFILRTYGNLSFSEIGKYYKKSESWARVTYHRGKLEIRKKILEE